MKSNFVAAITPRAAPTFKVLGALIATVAVAHWFALGGGIPGWPNQGSNAPSELGALPSAISSASRHSNAPTGTPPSALVDEPVSPMVVTATLARWIAPPEPAKAASRPKASPAAAPKSAPEKPPQPSPIETASPDEPLADIAWEIDLTSPGPVLTATEGDPAPLTPKPVEIQLAQTPTAPAAMPLPAPKPASAPAPAPSLQLEAAPTQVAAIAPSAPVEMPASNAMAPTNPTSHFPPNAVLKYEVKGAASGFSYSAFGTLTWNQNGSTYEAQQEVSVFLLGSFLQTSSGQVAPTGLAPNLFSDSRRGKEKTANFDYTKGHIRYSTNGTKAPLLPGAQDQLSATLQLAAMMSAQPNLPNGHILKLPVSSTGYSEVWRFEVGPLKALKLPAGEVEARLLTRGPRKPRDKTIQLWLAPSLGYLPVRMRLTEHGGDFLDQLLREMPEISAQDEQGQGNDQP